jgi:hypothetical protein
VKRLLLGMALVLAGLAAGGVWTWLQPDRYRADARVLVRPASARPIVETLAESSLVKSNVAQTLHLSSPPAVDAKTGAGGVLTVSAEAGTRERARQIDAETVVVLTQKVAQRFGTAPGVTATVLDPAHVAEQTSPTAERNLLIAGLPGLLAGVAVAGLLSPRRRPSAAAQDPRVERRLQARIDQVAKRERELAQRAGQLAAREQDLGRREEEFAAPSSPPSAENAVTRHAPELERRERALEQREAALRARGAELEAAAAVPEPEPEPEPVPQRQEALPALAGSWTLDALEERVRARRNRFPHKAEEWDTYLFLLRGHADVDGSLPRSFDALIAEVFADAVAG